MNSISKREPDKILLEPPPNDCCSVKKKNISTLSKADEIPSCCDQATPPVNIDTKGKLTNLSMTAFLSDEPCCGPPQGPPCSPFEKSGYSINHYVQSFLVTASGSVPIVATDLKLIDHIGTLRARFGFHRDQYKISPGLYCTGKPGPEDPVLVTSNYKLSFDALRQELAGIDLWILALDTRGVNVWCAAGKRTFSTEEVVRQIKKVGLEKVVNHREIIIPQLGGPGVAAHKVKKDCGFTVHWGPIRAADLRQYLENGNKVSQKMRQVTFQFFERLVLIPVEISLIIKPSIWILLTVFLLSGIGPYVFSPNAAWFRGFIAAVAYGTGIITGAVIVPILLPWLPSRKFFVKGLFTGFFGGALIAELLNVHSLLEMVSLIFFTMTVSSFAAMNFTGATPFTSPTGVEKEMRQGIPIQVMVLLISTISWLAAPFVY